VHDRYGVFGFTVDFSGSAQMAFSWGKRQLTMVIPVYTESENAIDLGN
jgi:hypothetical protein